MLSGALAWGVGRAHGDCGWDAGCGRSWVLIRFGFKPLGIGAVRWNGLR